MELHFKHREFERAVRAHLHLFDRPITDADAASVTDLDLSDFYFLPEDGQTLSCFRNLTALASKPAAPRPIFGITSPSCATCA